MSKKVKPFMLWDGMSYRQHKRIGKYVRELANMLGLHDWTLLLSWEPCDDDAHASIEVTDHQHRAVISLEKGFNNLSKKEKRRVLIHELMHCHEQKATEMIFGEDSPLPDLLGVAAWQAFEFAVHKDTELMVDNIAIVIERLLDDSSFAKYLEDKK